MIEISCVDHVHDFRECHGRTEDVCIGLQRVISADLSIDLSRSSVLHQSVFIQDIDDVGGTAAGGDLHCHLFIASGTDRAKSGQIRIVSAG